MNSELDKANRHIEFMSELKQSGREGQLDKTLKKSQEMVGQEMPMPLFSKKLGETQKVDYNSTISERLIESINMVRELLKSNKELREKLENAEHVI